MTEEFFDKEQALALLKDRDESIHDRIEALAYLQEYHWDEIVPSLERLLWLRGDKHGLGIYNEDLSLDEALCIVKLYGAFRNTCVQSGNFHLQFIFRYLHRTGDDLLTIMRDYEDDDEMLLALLLICSESTFSDSDWRSEYWRRDPQKRSAIVHYGLSILSHDNERIREAVIGLLPRQGILFQYGTESSYTEDFNEFLPVLIPLLDDPAPQVKLKVLQYFHSYFSENEVQDVLLDAIPAIEQMQDDTDPEVCREAFTFLTRNMLRTDIPRMKQMLLSSDHRDVSCVYSALSTFLENQDDFSIPTELHQPLIDSIAVSVADGSRRYHTFPDTVLQHLPDHDTLILLCMTYYDHPDPLVRSRVISLVNFLQGVFPWEQHRMKFWNQYIAGKNISDLGFLFAHYDDRELFAYMLQRTRNEALTRSVYFRHNKSKKRHFRIKFNNALISTEEVKRERAGVLAYLSVHKVPATLPLIVERVTSVAGHALMRDNCTWELAPLEKYTKDEIESSPLLSERDKKYMIETLQMFSDKREEYQ